MTKMMRLLALALVAGLFMVACNRGDDRDVNLTAVLSGEEAVCEGETCGADGAGTADIEISSDRTKICWEITGLVGSVEGVTAMHIHSGAKGEVGPVAGEFFSGNRACAEVDHSPGGFTKSALQDIAQRPESFYVDIHSTRYPDGAVRGQLEVAP